MPASRGAIPRPPPAHGVTPRTRPRLLLVEDKTGLRPTEHGLCWEPQEQLDGGGEERAGGIGGRRDDGVDAHLGAEEERGRCGEEGGEDGMQESWGEEGVGAGVGAEVTEAGEDGAGGCGCGGDD